MNVKRIFRHLLYPQWLSRRAFSDAAMNRIEAAVAASERTHHGEIFFAVETALDTLPLMRGVSARERALQVFADAGVWDTEANNGVLIYLLLADRDVEIIADRGFQACVSAAEWQTICHEMETLFAAGDYEAGGLKGVERVGAVLARHFPVHNSDGNINPNELSDRPLRLL